MRCAICIRQERGFGWFDPQTPLFSPQRQKSYRKFCSMRCQDIYAAQRRRHAMIDPTPLERAALQACLKPMGELMAEIGFDVPPARYSREQALQLVEVIVTAFQNRLQQEHASGVFCQGDHGVLNDPQANQRSGSLGRGEIVAASADASEVPF